MCTSLLFSENLVFSRVQNLLLRLLLLQAPTKNGNENRQRYCLEVE